MNRIFYCIIAILLACAGMTSAQSLSSSPVGGSFVGEDIPAHIEQMYQKGVRYLIASQQPNGIWSNPGGQAGAGIQGLALLALVADGSDPQFGPHAGTISRGLDAMLKEQDENGYFGPSMYHHGFATLALAELYGALDDTRIGPALLKALALILQSQEKNSASAWRYRPEGLDADTTASGGQVVALFAARNAGLYVPDAAIQSAVNYYKSCQGSDGGIGYTSPTGGSAPRNAIAVLIGALAHEQQSDFFRGAWRWLRQAGDTGFSSYYFYYLYYASQAYFRADMHAWRRWNEQTAQILASSQNQQGGWDGPHGSAFCTSAALLTLALNYRYLPIYER